MADTGLVFFSSHSKVFFLRYKVAFRTPSRFWLSFESNKWLAIWEHTPVQSIILRLFKIS